jgi:hypothetical protein
MRCAASAAIGAFVVASSLPAAAQAPGGWGAPPPASPGQPQPGYGQPGYGAPPPGYGTSPGQYPLPAQPLKRSDVEIGTLYVVSVAYGVGMGVWFSAELEIDDPGIFLIPPAVLGIAAPAGVYYLDDPEMPEGMPAAMAAGAAIGAGEGIGIASYQFVTTEEKESWGFKGLARATAIGSTAGGIAGYAVGYYMEPPPRSSVFVSSTTLWGTTIGSMYGYGASEADIGYGRANDSAALGGLIGYNLGLAAGAVFSAIEVPSWEQTAFMWIGGGIGAAVSLPVFLLYAASEKPAKRGFLFMGTATTLGIVAGGLFASGAADEYEIGKLQVGPTERRFATLDYVAPFAVEGGAGLSLGGTLE